MSNQEVWITVRLKGELPIEMDATEAANQVLTSIMDHPMPCGFVLQDWQGAHEVIEVQEEAQIYNLELNTTNPA